jgi:hypothetical protein
MTKSKKTKSKSRKQRLSLPQKVSQNPKHETQPQGIGHNIANNLGIVLLGVVASIAGIIGFLTYVWGPFWPTPPELHPIGNDFSLPFSVNNRNNWFDLTDISFKCALGPSESTDPRVHYSYDASVSHIFAAAIPAGTHANFRCNSFPDGYEVKTAKIWVSIEYTMRWHGWPVTQQKAVADNFSFEHGAWVAGVTF